MSGLRTFVAREPVWFSATWSAWAVLCTRSFTLTIGVCVSHVWLSLWRQRVRAAFNKAVDSGKAGFMAAVAVASECVGAGVVRMFTQLDGAWFGSPQECVRGLRSVMATHCCWLDVAVPLGVVGGHVAGACSGREEELPSNWRHKLAGTRHPRLTDPGVWQMVFGDPQSWRVLADSGNLTPYDYVSHEIKFA